MFIVLNFCSNYDILVSRKEVLNLKISNTSERLKQIMHERNLRQVDILKATEYYCEQYGVKMNKSDISQYCSGKVEPNQDKLFILSAALNVNISWLMGYDVSIEPYKYSSAKRDLCIYQALEHGLRSFGWNIKLEQIDDNAIQYIISNDACSITVPEEYITSTETKLKQFLINELKEVFLKQNELLFNIADSDSTPTCASISEIPSHFPTTLAAHFDGDEYTEEELDDIQRFVDTVKKKNNSPQ